MSDKDEQFQLDFGTEELNDPNYEENVGGDGSVSIEGTPPDGVQQATPAEGEQSSAPQPADQQVAQSGEAATQQQPAQQQQDGRPKTDKDGNLVDAQGNVIAKAGAERRTYERTQAQASYIQRLEAENKQLRDNDSMAKALNDVPTKLGLSMQDTEMGLQAIASFKKDPVATARWMLQETMRLGYDLKQIVGADAEGQINGGSMDLQAIKSIIADQVQPLLADRDAAQADTQALEAAKRDYDKFMATHDHAGVHEDTLARLLEQNTSLTPEVAYWQLREYAAKHQLDFAQPLGPQMQARQQGGNASQGNATPQAQTPMTMPNGSAPAQDMQTAGTYADADEAWDSIVNQSLKEAGFTH